jgi:hypothetical protein
MMNCDRPVCSTVWQAITKSANTIVTECLWLIFKNLPLQLIFRVILPIIWPKKSGLMLSNWHCLASLHSSG